jgi:uncharacterized Zn-binding protein involved in type VI secretion
MSGPQRITNLPAEPPPAADKKPPNTVRKVQEFVAGVMAIPFIPANIANQAVAKATRFIAQALPSLPAARVMKDKVLGIPHAHGHPPNLIPPAPPVPLPNVGTVLASGAVSVLINGQPAARCGDVGFEIWCGGLCPMFEIQTGSSNVFIGGARASRAGDIAKHCMPSTALGKLAVAMSAASAVVGGLGVAADLIDMGDLDDAAADAGTPAEAAADSAAASAMATAAAMTAAQTASDIAAAALAALQAAAGADPGCPPGIPAGAFVTGSDNVKIGGFPMPGWGTILSGLGKLLKSLRERWRNRGRMGHDPGYRAPSVKRRNPEGKRLPRWFQQEETHSCLCACVRMLIHSLTGKDVAEVGLREKSEKYPGGFQHGVGAKLLNGLEVLKWDYNIDNAYVRGGNLNDLQQATANGHPAIIHTKPRNAEGKVVNHAVVVDKVHTNPDGSKTVEGRDPGSGGGHFVEDESDFQKRNWNGQYIGTDPGPPVP